MLAPARRGFRARFELEVRAAARAAGESPSDDEVRARVDRLLRSWMLDLARRSAAARRREKADPVGEMTGIGQEVRRGGGEPRAG
jgi:hypothetical protein